MKIVVAAVGRLKDGPERELLDRYGKRLAQAGRSLGLAPVEFVETPEGRGEQVAVRQADEASRLLRLASACSVVVALDENGRSIDSRGFAGMIARHRDGGANGIAFLVGGPDGHGDEALAKATVRISLGAMTLPHGLARVVLAEQLYRAATILAGHPYHRD